MSLSASNGGTPSEKRIAVGALEGFIIADRIRDLAENAKSLRRPDLLNKTLEYLAEWHNRIRSQANAETLLNPYWRKIQLVLDRFDGLVKVLNHPCSTIKVSFLDLLLLQSDGDVVDVEKMLAHQSESVKDALLIALDAHFTSSGLRHGSERAEKNDEKLWKSVLAQSKCSALVRMTNSGDVILGHATWAYYAEMIRVFKHVDYGAAEGRTSYSGFAGMIASTDDFYLNHKGLAVAETSLNIIDARSLEYLLNQPYRGVPSWIRTVIAMENAGSATEWIQLFTEEFSYTYNCQWMILDRNQLESTTGLFTVLESLPGKIAYKDMTKVLRTKGFFSSQNTPMLQEIRLAGGYPDVGTQLQNKACGSCQCHFSYDENPRGCIFKRDAPNVKTIEDMKVLLRSNNWKTDVLSFGHPEEAIAGRLDLIEEVEMREPAGAIDAKVISLRDVDAFASASVIGGIVVNDECPAFSDWDLFRIGRISFKGVASSLNGGETWFQTKRTVL